MKTCKDCHQYSNTDLDVVLCKRHALAEKMALELKTVIDAWNFASPDEFEQAMEAVRELLKEWEGVQ